MEEEDGEKELTELQKEIEAQIEKDMSRRRKVCSASYTSSPGPVSQGMWKLIFLNKEISLLARN